MKFYIKNMVSIRCKMVAKSELENLGIHYTSVEIGWIDIEDPVSPENLCQLKTGLLKWGLELMGDKRSILTEKIKNIIVEMIHYSDELPKIKFSNYISKKLDCDYAHASNIFSELQGTSISHFIILHKIERVKKLLSYHEMSLTGIAELMQYSSVAHLANQFKKITHITTTQFKNAPLESLKCLEEV